MTSQSVTIIYTKHSLYFLEIDHWVVLGTAGYYPAFPPAARSNSQNDLLHVKVRKVTNFKSLKVPKLMTLK